MSDMKADSTSFQNKIMRKLGKKKKNRPPKHDNNEEIFNEILSNYNDNSKIKQILLKSKQLT